MDDLTTLALLGIRDLSVEHIPGKEGEVMGQMQPKILDSGLLTYRIMLWPEVIALSEEMLGRPQYRDTLLHEAAHYLHYRTMEPRIYKMAESSHQPALKMRTRYAMQLLFHGANSDHGTQWRKLARQVGAEPTAKPRWYPS